MLISFGELLVDMVRGGDKFKPFPGGAPANFSVALGRLGIKPKLIASVGRDFFGDMLINSLERENVDIDCIKRSEKRTSMAFVELKGGAPEFVFYRNADTDISKDDVDIGIFEGAKWLHFGSLSLTEDSLRETLFHCIRMAKRHELKVSFSPNIRSDLWSESFDSHLYRFLDYVDVLILPKSEFDYMFGPDDPKKVGKNYYIEKIIVTEGENGCTLYSKNIIKQPIFSVNTIDTTGAGDAFSAGFVYSQLKGKSDKESLRFASMVAALSTTGKGAMSSLPTLKEVEDSLSKHRADRV